MKFSSTILIASAAAVASAASSTTTSVALTPQESCVISCPSGDVSCQADCVGAPHPDAAGANATTECASNCDQGDGSSSQTDKYAACLQKCYSAYYLTTGGAGPTLATVPAGVSTSAGGATPNAASATGAAASGSSGSGSGSGSNGNSGSSASGTAGSSGSSTASGSAAGASSSTGVAPYIQVGTSAVGLVGLVMGIFAL